MSEICLVVGTIPRADLLIYFSANISKENAIKSLEYWKKGQGEYYDFHIDRIEINDLEEHDAEIIDKFAETLKSRLGDAIYPKDFESMRNLIDDVRKEQKNED